MRASADPAKVRQLLRDLRAALDSIRPDLIRYPALDSSAFERRVEELLEADDA